MSILCYRSENKLQKQLGINFLSSKATISFLLFCFPFVYHDTYIMSSWSHPIIPSWEVAWLPLSDFSCSLGSISGDLIYLKVMEHWTLTSSHRNPLSHWFQALFLMPSHLPVACAQGALLASLPRLQPQLIHPPFSPRPCSLPITDAPLRQPSLFTWNLECYFTLLTCLLSRCIFSLSAFRLYFILIL